MSRTLSLLEGPILPTLLRLSGPNVLNAIAIGALIVFDGYFVGRLGAEALAGTSLVFPFLIAAQHLAASGMGGAVASAVARAVGRKDRERAALVATHAFWLAIGLAAVTSLLMLSLGPAIYRAMGAAGPVLEAASSYSAAVFAGIVSVFVLNILASVVRGTGDMMFPALLLSGTIVVHLLVSPLLIFGWGPVPALGAAGAGLGLVIAFGAGGLYVLAYLSRAASPLPLKLWGPSLRWAVYGEIFKVGLPGMINVAVNSTTVAALTGMMAGLGLHAQLGYAIGARLEYIIIPLAFVVGTALVTMVGTNWGAGNYARARRIAWIGAFVAGALCTAVGVFFAVWPEAWMRFFTREPQVLESGARYLRIVAPAYGLFAFGQALYFASQGFGNPLPAVLANVGRLAISIGVGLLVIASLGGGEAAVFGGIAGGFVFYAAANAAILIRAGYSRP